MSALMLGERNSTESGEHVPFRDTNDRESSIAEMIEREYETKEAVYLSCFSVLQRRSE